MTMPETRYAKTVDGLHIAYQILGEGPVDASADEPGGEPPVPSLGGS